MRHYVRLSANGANFDGGEHFAVAGYLGTEGLSGILGLLSGEIDTKHKPVCIYKDGVFVLDDVGLHGFISFLKEIYEGEDKEERSNYKAWAQSQAFANHRAMEAVLGVILKLPPMNQIMASRQFKSIYLDKLLSAKGVERS